MDQGPSAQETLGAIRVPVMDLHSGITPKCRGQAGGYWTLVNGDPDQWTRASDTGEVTHQARFESNRRDDFATYFYPQAAVFRPIAVKAVEDAPCGDLKPYRPALPSGLRYHPARWADLARGLQVGIWQGSQRVS